MQMIFDDRSSLEEFLRKQAIRELQLREQLAVNAPESLLEMQRGMLTEIKEKIQESYKDIPSDLTKAVYLNFLNSYLERLRMSTAKPFCEICRYIFENKDGSKTEDLDDPCTVHPKRPGEMALSDIALCEDYDPKYGNEEQEIQLIREKMQVTEQFIAEVQQKSF